MMRGFFVLALCLFVEFHDCYQDEYLVGVGEKVSWTKQDEYRSQRLLSLVRHPPVIDNEELADIISRRTEIGIYEQHKHLVAEAEDLLDEAPQMPDFRMEKRDFNIPIYPWAYQLSSWGFVNKDLNFALNVNYKLLESRDSLMTFQERSDVPQSDMCFEVEVNDANRNIVFLVGWMASWVSLDAGTSFKKEPGTNNKFGLIFHPKNKNWALISGEVTNLYVSKDLGKTWSLVASNVIQYDWCHAGTHGLSEERICIIQANRDSHSDGLGYFKLTQDLGRTWSVPLSEHATSFDIHDRFFTLIAKFNETLDLYVSSDYGVHFNRALLPEMIPVGALQQSQLLEDDYGVIWIVVSHSIISRVSSRGNLYVSDAEGYKFTKALSDVHTLDNWWDVELVSSIEGTFLANILKVEDPILIKTAITWDNGDTWHNLEAPTVDSNGTQIACTGYCSLNLYGITTWLGAGGGFFGPVYSDTHAVGMIIGTGGVGNFLPNNEPDKINTYFSRDGGLSWDELMKGSTIYEYGNFGGLLVLASNVAPTSTIYYSLNGGITFSSFELPEVVKISNIVISSTQNERFIVISTSIWNPDIKKFWGLDFSFVHEGNCTEKDYETWEPHDGVRGPKCVLGHDITYKRKKREAACYTEDGLNKVLTQTNCTCDQERDYECDYGFEKGERSGACGMENSRIISYDAEMRASQCINQSTVYYVSSGYRKLPGDSCINDIKAYAPIPLQCSNINTPTPTSRQVYSKTYIAGIVFAVIVAFLFVGAIGFLFGLRNENFRKKFPWVKAPAWVHYGYANDLVDTNEGVDVDAEAEGEEDFVGTKTEQQDDDVSLDQ